MAIRMGAEALSLSLLEFSVAPDGGVNESSLTDAFGSPSIFNPIVLIVMSIAATIAFCIKVKDQSKK
jgi:hypothetical protein